MKQVKQTYLVLLIVISLFSLALYSTYAMFEAEINTNNIVSIDTSISMDTGIDEYQITTIEPSSYKILDINIQNTKDKDLYYGVWIEQISTDIQNINAYKLDTSLSQTVDIIPSNKTNKVSIVLINNARKKSTIKIGIATSETSSLNLTENRILITEEISKDNIRNETACEYIKSLYTIDSEDLYLDDNDNLIYYGNNPKNYILLNQELWQIIGVYQNQIKIIKTDSIGTYAYDDENNYLENSKINYLLNELYNKSEKGNCYQNNTSQECDLSKTGLTEETKDKIAIQTINNEIISLTENSNISEISPTVISTFQNEVTLLSLEDYKKTLYCKEEICETSWLSMPNTLLSTQNIIDDTKNAISITDTKELELNNSSSTDLEIRPVLLLKENNQIIKGEGTRDNPYVLK